ncbi:MAG: hypothetical protein F6K08_23010, partial [Okeania sp. SIO1H6]|nr:hypothetical protein [Okeania sp. SIO1H6]
MQTEQTQKIMGYFIEEAKDHFNTIEHGILNLPNTIADRELLNELFRAAHSVKGGAAMLEINSVRNIAHRLEDSFKILRETSIKVDNKLESLYLSVLDTLQDLLEQLSNSGLTEKEEKTQLEKLEPVFQELEEHLDDLAGETHGITIGKIPELNVDKQSFFMAEVSEKMREMLLLFKQNDDASTRNKLKNICDFLAGQGRQEHVSSNWLKLIEAIKKAIANTENTYYTLAHNIIKNLKQAEELIRDNREQEILIDEKLKALTKNAEYINKNIGEIDMLNETKNQQNQTNINERINNKNDILTQKKESINDWFNKIG